MNEAQFQRFLERYARALSEANLTAIADCWAMPSLVVGDDGAQAIHSMDEVTDHFAPAIERYHAHGIITTRARLEQAQVLSERIAALDVRWSDFDTSGIEHEGSRNRYLVRLEDDGHLRIHVSVARGH